MADDDQRRDRARFYDRQVRDPEAIKFYNSTAWKRVRADKVLRTPYCEVCKLTVVEIVHHVIPLDQCTEEQKTDLDNLQSICRPCHNATHADMDRAAKNAPVRIVTGQLQPVDDDQFFYDEQRGTAIERFALKYCRYYRGRELRGKPFALHPIQLEFLRPTFGFIDRQTGLRRFTSLWLETGVGSGKTPVMAIIGLHDLLTTGGAQIYSVSNTFAQANYSFDAARLFIKNSPLLSNLKDKKGRKAIWTSKFEIVYTPLDAKWNLISGDGSKAGAACSTLLVDEVHQIEDRSCYDDIQGRMTKSDEPLVVYATNAAKNPHSLYGDLHEVAQQTLAGRKRANRSMFPVVWAAPPDADPSSIESAKLANRLIGVTISEAAVIKEWNESQGSPALEARYRLLYLGQQVSAVQRWLDLDAWDACSQQFTPEQVASLPLYMGIDSSGGDDLLAVIKCWPSRDRIYGNAEFWLPQATADHYETKDEITYSAWKTAGDINLIAEKTISIEVQQRIAREIIATHQTTPITMVAYDRAYSEHLIEELKAAGIRCEKVSQGWGVSSGCRELDRRLKERSITIAPNAVMRFCAENATVKHDERGNYWPVKPNASGKYAGTRSKKIDGISAFVTALTKAREHDFPRAEAHVGAYILNLDADDED